MLVASKHPYRHALRRGSLVRSKLQGAKQQEQHELSVGLKIQHSEYGVRCAGATQRAKGAAFAEVPAECGQWVPPWRAPVLPPQAEDSGRRGK